ncbi:MAG: hypothetical protein MJ248_05950 [Bacilli bacterium]|nr:hypothetical protein [Bacilli bacterium]
MKNKKVLTLVSTILLATPLLSSCVANLFEKEITVTLECYGDVIDSGTVTQFKNFLTSTSEAQSTAFLNKYVPSDMVMLGWTPYTENQLSKDPVTFKTQYIYFEGMVHYKDVVNFAVDGKVTLHALIMDPDEVPTVYHYSVLAWYDKEATSGITSSEMSKLESGYKTYLANKGVSQSDIDSVDFRGYSGNVGPSTSKIRRDIDVDVMLGWGSLDNITSTGTFKPEAVYDSVAYPVTYKGETKTRYIHRISEKPVATDLMEYLQLPEVKAIFNS